MENLSSLTDCKNQPISAVFLDYKMPVLNGFKAIEEIKRIYKSLNEIFQNYKCEYLLILPNFVMMSDYSNKPAFTDKLKYFNIDYVY